jgi:hypothetical protein
MFGIFFLFTLGICLSLFNKFISSCFGVSPARLPQMPLWLGGGPYRKYYVTSNNTTEAAKCQSAKQSNGTWMWRAKRNELKEELRR